MPKKYIKKADRKKVASEIQGDMEKNQVEGNVQKVDFTNRQSAEDALTATERFQAMPKEEQEAALAKVRALAKGKKQTDLPGIKGAGVEQVVIQEIEDAKSEYSGYLEQRQTALKLEVEAKKQLIGLMKARKQKAYKCEDGIVVVLKHKDESDDIKIQKPKDMEIEED